MSRITAQSLYARLPAYYREADAAAGGLVHALMELIAAQADRIGAQIDEMRDGWFIETCPDWAVPYLGDLLGVPLTHDLRFDGSLTSVVPRRAQVANTIRYRRRKGTVSVLESLAFDVGGWRTVAVEELERLWTTQHLAHPRTSLPNTVDLRSGANLEATPGPFAVHAHTIDVRGVRLDRPSPVPRPNVPTVDLHVYHGDGLLLPLATARFTGAGGRYHADPLGRDLPLVNPPVHDPGVEVRTGEDEVPAPLRRRRLREQLDARRAALAAGREDPAPRWVSRPPFQLYLVPAPGDAPVPVPATRIEICRLDPWRDPSPSGRARVDPVTGRVVLPDPLPHHLLVTAAPGGVAGIGAGPSPRPAIRDELAGAGVGWQLGVARDEQPVPGRIVASLEDAVTAWNARPPGTVGVIALLDNDRHDVALTGDSRVLVPEGSHLTIVAAGWPRLPVAGGVPGETARRPGVVTPERLRPAIVGDVEVSGTAPAGDDAPGTLTLDGLLLSGSIRVTGIAGQQLGRLRVRSCTQVTGGVKAIGQHPLVAVEIDASFVGAVALPPSVSEVSLARTVVDGTGEPAIEAPGAHAVLDAVTALGRANVKQLDARQCLLCGRVTTAIQQEGCVRYSYLPRTSVTPRRYRCLDAPAPAFVSARRGHRAYAVLTDGAGEALRTGGEHGDELGAYAVARTTHREQNTAIALSEYLRAGTAAGVVRVM